ncbi:PAS domain S-box protein [uncultured Desulfobacter sp.]|uniref:PAS domain S-box protein n=1 Tax=uncultured Desulfobacter sp. TaxID=240139 RepID=UPI002AAC0CB4|nr:PAS domain S-box protein [uncultured Desulfobacter sp.]
MTTASIQNTAQLRRRLLGLCVLLICGVGLAAGLLGLLPLNNRLSAQALSELEHQLDLQRLIVEGYHQHLVGLGLQVGSRTQIRKALMQYNQGEIDLDKLVSFSTPKLADALRQAPELLGMVRLDRQGRPVIRLGKPLEEGMWPSAGSDPQQVVSGRSGVDDQGTKFLALRIPIVDDKKQVHGTDLFMCNLASLRKRLAEVSGRLGSSTRILTRSPDGWQSLLIPAGTEDGLAAAVDAGTVAVPKAGEERCSSWWSRADGKQEFVVLVCLMPADWLLAVGQDKETLMGAANRILIWVGIAYAALLLLGISGVVLLLRPLTGHLLVHQKELERLVDEQAHALMQSDENLREKTLFLDNIVNTIPDLIWLKDPEGVYLTCNPEFELFYGAAEKDILGKTDYDFVSGELAAFFRKKDQEAITAGRISINEEEVVYRSDGRHVTLETRKVPVFDANGSVLGVLGIGRNITERKRMEAQLLSSENRLRDILNSTSDWIWEVDAKGCYTFCSEGIQRVLKYRPEEMLGRTPFDLMPSEEQGRGRTAFLELVEQKAPLVDLENWNVAKNGRRVCLVTNGVPLLDDQGDLLGYRGADRDITVQKMLQIQVQERTEELERSNRELEQFAYAASHDLQEPLRMVASYVKLLARRYKGKLDADADDFINYAADGAERMQRMINDLLAYSRITTKGQEPELVDSTNCLKTALANLSLSIEEAGADVTNSDLPQVLADENQINQLFQNLVGNALKFSKPGEIPRIHVDAIQQDKELLFSVRDNGIGIKKEDQDRIFQLFHRLHTREEYPGTGIGLSLCQRIVVRHGGRIWVESESGSGATFYFTLPLPKESNHV